MSQLCSYSSATPLTSGTGEAGSRGVAVGFVWKGGWAWVRGVGLGAWSASLGTKQGWWFVEYYPRDTLRH